MTKNLVLALAIICAALFACSSEDTDHVDVLGDSLKQQGYTIESTTKLGHSGWQVVKLTKPTADGELKAQILGFDDGSVGSVGMFETPGVEAPEVIMSGDEGVSHCDLQEDTVGKGDAAYDACMSTCRADVCGGTCPFYDLWCHACTYGVCGNWCITFFNSNGSWPGGGSNGG